MNKFLRKEATILSTMLRFGAPNVRPDLLAKLGIGAKRVINPATGAIKNRMGFVNKQLFRNFANKMKQATNSRPFDQLQASNQPLKDRLRAMSYSVRELSQPNLHLYPRITRDNLTNLRDLSNSAKYRDLLGSYEPAFKKLITETLSSEEKEIANRILQKLTK